MSYKTLDEVFAKHTDVTFDINLLKQFKLFRISWSQKSDDYMEFLGNNLTGVYSIKFSILDETTFFNILGIDRDALQKDIYQVKGINKDFKTISNAVYVTLIWCCHKFANTKLLNKKEIEDALQELYLIFCYKVFSSLNSHYFKYTIDITIAKAINERMSAKFLVKRFNSWQEIFEYKSKDLIKGGLHEKRILHGSVDDITRVIQDTQSKLRDIFKNNYAVFIEVMEANERISNTSLIEMTEEGEAIKSVSNRKDIYLNNIKSIISLPSDFINEDIVAYLAGIFRNIKDKDMMNILRYLTEHYDKNKDLQKLLDDAFYCNLDYINKRGIKSDYVKNLHEITLLIKGYYSAAHTSDNIVKVTKKELPKYIKKCTKVTNASLLNNFVIFTLLYLLIRSFYIKNY